MNKYAMKKILIWAGAIWPLLVQADIQPAGLFTDHMVIQQKTKAPVWGTGDAGEAVTVSGSWGASAKAVVDAGGTWMVKLKTPKAGGPHTMTIQGNNSIELKDVLSGEVWFCSGQSNMDFILNQLTRVVKTRTEEEYIPAAHYIQQEVQSAADDQLRQFTVTKAVSPLKPLEELAGSWIASAPAHNKDFSATAYFFGRELRQVLDVPVGLIKCAWGGTRVEPWIPRETYEQDEAMAAYFATSQSELKQAMAKWNPKQVDAKFKTAMKKWQETKKGRKPRKASPPEVSQQLPTTLFNGMVNPVIPYAIRGAIWSQEKAGYLVPLVPHVFRIQDTS